MPGVYVGETKSLVFPVMCDGYLQLKYLEKNANTSVDLALREGVWGHTGSFSIEAIITPYDVNGYGSRGSTATGVTTSEKTPPSVNVDNSSLTDYQSEDYFNTTRTDRKLMIFHNANFQFYLENTTANNFNQPAEYRLGVKVQTQTPVVSNTLIGSHNTIYGKYDLNSRYEGISTNKTLLQANTTVSSNTITFPSGAANVAKLAVGSEIFNDSGVSLGTVVSIPTTTTITVADASSHTAKIYVSQPKEAFYMESLIKVGCTFHSNGTIQLFVNGDLVAEELKTVSDFNFGTTDCYIGQDPDTANTQFMGELHEISMYTRPEPTLSSTTLSPGYNNILFYYRFGE